MKLKNHKKELEKIYVSVGGVIAETARVFAKENNIQYDDTLRRKISSFLSRNGISRQTPQNIKDENSKWEENVTKDEAYLEKVASEKVKSLDDLVRICQIDLNIWEVERWLCNAWGVTAFKHEAKGTYRTNYQVKVWLKKKKLSFEDGLVKVLKVLDKYTPKKLAVTTTGSKQHIVASMADFHIGADIKNLMRTHDFNIEVLLNYLDYCVNKINSYKAEKVTLNLLGDFYESISGMNHENTFKSLGDGMWGANVIIIANEIMSTHLLSKINNLVKVNIISGNHDRMTASNRLDNTGEGAKVLWHMLKKDFPLLPIDFSNSVMSTEIDGVCYVLTHGDKSLSKKELSKVVYDYGNPNLFTLLMEGHFHTRKTVKAITQKAKFYEETEVVSLDEVNYRKINVASLFTGNYFSESLGFAGNAGMTISFNNGVNGKPEVHDITI